MKKPAKQIPLEPKPLVPQFDAKAKEWLVEIAPGHTRVFVTREEAEAFCAKKTSEKPKRNHCQELPESSVWTGAPWDHTFKHLN